MQLVRVKKTFCCWAKGILSIKIVLQAHYDRRMNQIRRRKKNWMYRDVNRRKNRYYCLNFQN